jgi:putative ABC transport system substrate-binding protein
MNRKMIVATLVIFFLHHLTSSHAQKKAAIPRIGLINAGAPGDPQSQAFLEGLRDLGYIDGKNILIESRYANGKVERLPEFAHELVKMKVDAIYTSNTRSMFAVKELTKTIPIVIVSTTDPVQSGLVASLARPGGNVTGVSLMASDLWPKRLELLKEVTPKLSHVAIFWNKSNAGMAIEAKATFDVAGPLGVTLQDRGIKHTDEIEAVLAAIGKDRPDGFLPLLDISLRAHQERILDFLLKHHLPAIFERKEVVDLGGLISYGPSYEEVYRRAAVHMDKVLKGIKPADIPVEQPMKLEMAINLNTAKQIGLTIPPNVLARADRVHR